MTFVEFEQLPDDPRGWRQELYRGEVFALAPPKHDHYKIQLRLMRLLDRVAGDTGVVGMEMGFRPLPDHEYWYPDVAFLSKDRWDAIPAKGNLQGSPELVVEVLSPSNTAAEILYKKEFCLENGAREFWVVSIDQTLIEVSTADGHSITYKSGQQIPLFFAPGRRLAVNEVFG